MNKCKKCGTEFEGNCCPNCGTWATEEKTCPKCGTKLKADAKFCSGCGFSFENAKQPKSGSHLKEKFAKIGAWVKSHLKIVVPAVLAVLLVLILSISIPTCIAAQNNGTYYKLGFNGELDKKTYYVINSGSWTDDDGESGNYKLDGENITLYITFFGETEELASGTLKDGVLKIKTGFGETTFISEKHSHSYGEWETTRAATCTNDGLQTRVCACGVKETKDIKCVGHHTGTWETTKEATCTETGLKTMTCTVCKQEVEETIEKVSHTLGKWTFDKTNHYKVCSVCGGEFEKATHNGAEKCNVCEYPLIDTVGLAYKINSDNSGYILTGLGSSTDKIIIIPAQYNDLPVTSIGNSAFEDCTSITDIIMPDSIISIGNNAFYGCRNLSTVAIGNGVADIGSRAFYNCIGLSCIYVAENNNAYACQNGILYNKEKTQLICVPQNISGAIVIPNGVQRIEDGQFKNCKKLLSITIPDSVTYIGLTAFRDCNGLTDIYFNGDVAQWCSIPELNGIMGNVIDGAKLFINGNEVIGDLIIPDGVVSIGGSAFMALDGLTSITIPDSLKSIGWHVFNGCTGLQDIYYKGTKMQWNAISKGNGWSAYAGNFKVHCLDGDI